MSLLSQFFPSSAGGSNATGDFGSSLTTDLSTFPIDVLLVGGGGGGGIVPTTKNAGFPGTTDPNAAIGGGGGGGRLIQYLNAVISTGTPYPITVGAGGAAGANGGVTCFGSTLIAGGGGAAGTPSTFGRGQYEPGSRGEFDGSWGGDTVYTCPQLMRVAAPNPSYPYFAANDIASSASALANCSLYASGRKYSECKYYGDTTFASTYYDFVDCSGTGRCIYTVVGKDVACDSYPFDASCFYGNSVQAGNSIEFPGGPLYYGTNCYNCDAGFIKQWCGGSPASPCETSVGTYVNAIFKKITHPQANYSRFGIGGLSGNGVQVVPYLSPNQICQFGTSCAYVNTQVGGASIGLSCYYIEGAKCGCFPNTTFGSNPQYKIVHPLGYAQLNFNPLANGNVPNNDGLCTNSADRAANGARAQFCPVSNVCIRTAMLATNCFSLMDHGPGLYNAPVNAYYVQDYGPNFGVPICSTNAYPSIYESGFNPQGCPSGSSGNYPSVQLNRLGVTPYAFNVICSTATTKLRMFNPNTDSVGLVTGAAAGLAGAPFVSGPLLPFLSATVSPVVEAAVWTAAENGVAGWGAGGGGGVNVGGIGTALAFRYQYYPGVIPSNATGPTNVVLPLYGRYDTNTQCQAFPIVCYSRCIGPSPAAMATGGSGGSGAVYIVYPTDYPAATVTGNTAVPSPPAYRVYYWTGNGTITFNQ